MCVIVFLEFDGGYELFCGDAVRGDKNVIVAIRKSNADLSGKDTSLCSIGARRRRRKVQCLEDYDTSIV